jgi:hypothetical protein
VTNRDDHFWDDLFHGAAWRAFIELIGEHGVRPDPEATRKLAYRYYEQALAEKVATRSRPPDNDAEALTSAPNRTKVVACS